ncbi:MAG: hypothetical protein ABSH56_18220 [Bryobacteraceae bacterium]|jgi:hypothetical protein
MFDKLMQTFEKLIITLIVLSLLPCLIGAIIHAIGTVNLLLVLGIVSFVAYLRHESRVPAAGKRRTAGAERSPLLPKGDD